METERHYSGSESHMFVDGLISGKGRELLIVSPYIDNYYARALLRASKRKRVRIVTSPDALEYRGSFLGSLSLHKMMGYAKATAYFSVLFAIGLYLKFYYVVAPIAVIAMAMFVLMLRSRNSANIRLKVIREPFVHEKLYICNGTAVTGSANLTYKGMHRNIEHVEVTSDDQEVAALERHFEELWSKVDGSN